MFLQARYPSGHVNNSLKALKRTNNKSIIKFNCNISSTVNDKQKAQPTMNHRIMLSDFGFLS